ncbi:M73 family metallopeptidase [bacterium]|nr:M73 family metallopeptidase [bacterium]
MKKSLVVAFLLTIVGALLIGGATMAWFTSEDTNEDNSFAAGTLEISLDKDNGQKYFDIKNIQPGDHGATELTVSNVGSLALNFNFSLTKESGLFDGKKPLVIVITDRSNKVVDPEAIHNLQAGSEETYTISWSMPEGASNDYQGASGRLGIGVYAEQVSND